MSKIDYSKLGIGGLFLLTGIALANQMNLSGSFGVIEVVATAGSVLVGSLAVLDSVGQKF